MAHPPAASAERDKRMKRHQEDAGRPPWTPGVPPGIWPESRGEVGLLSPAEASKMWLQ